jgi:hypothetical protein
VTPATRSARKTLVFPIIYGYCPQATKEEMAAWRALAAEYVGGARDTCPFSLEGFRAIRETAGK